MNSAAEDSSFTLPGLGLLDPKPSSEGFQMSPVLTGDALDAISPEKVPQRALYGQVISQSGSGPLRNNTFYVNTNAPFSAVICGVQGSGKSHSTSVLLESCLIKDSRIGTLPAPLSALIFYLDNAAGSGTVQPCEAAYLAALDATRGGDAESPDVTVLVLPSNLQNMRQVYAGLPNVKVEPLHFTPEDISGERLLTMMRLDGSHQLPIYAEAILTRFREMEPNFKYKAFREELDTMVLKREQRIMLNLRLALLDSCVSLSRVDRHISSYFRKGHATIVDLSSPFMDGESACGFFDLVLDMFVSADIEGAGGKLVVLDEAHKYLSESNTGARSANRLTESILSIMRQQRHLATRVVISTQEPTIVPARFLELSAFVIAHKFSSPAWMQHLSNHVSPCRDDETRGLLTKVLKLESGEAIIFAPDGLTTQRVQSEAESGAEAEEQPPTLARIGQGHLHVRCRQRITRDGGHALLAVPDKEPTRLDRVSVRTSSAAQDKGSIAERAAAMAKTKSHAESGTPAKGAFSVVDYIVGRFTNNGATGLSLDNIRKNFLGIEESALEDVLRRAELDGLLRREDGRVLPPHKPTEPALDPPASTHQAFSTGRGPQTLADYVKNRASLGATQLSFDTVRNHFAKDLAGLSDSEITAKISTALNEAAKAGRLVTKLHDGKQYVMLPPKVAKADKPSSPSGSGGTKAFSTFAAAGAAAVAAISLTGKHKRLGPFVRFVLARHSAERRPVELTAAQQYFAQKDPQLYGKKLKAFNQVASEAVKQGLLSGVPGTAKGKDVASVMPVPGAKYEIEVA